MQVWPYTNRGLAISVKDIPTTLKQMEDDPYRTLALWVRQVSL
jgi:hypothetical protein